VRVRVIALGSEMARDDGAALAAAARLTPDPHVDVVLAGRPGAGLLDLLEPDVPTLVLDVVRQGATPGGVLRLRLEELATATLDGKPISSHGLGVAQAFRLAEALDRPLPRGLFLGIGGQSFEPGDEPTPEVARGVGDLVTAAERAIAELWEGYRCTSTG